MTWPHPHAAQYAAMDDPWTPVKIGQVYRNWITRRYVRVIHLRWFRHGVPAVVYQLVDGARSQQTCWPGHLTRYYEYVGEYSPRHESAMA